MARMTILVVLLALLGACTVGPRAATTPLAREPRGANVTLQTADQPIVGELLEVQDTALLVLTRTEHVTLVPYRTIRQGQAELARRFTRDGRTPAPDRLERLRLISRFPHGLTPEMRRTLLVAYGQSEIQVVGQ